MVISSQLFESYLQCPTKCWLRWRAEQPTGNAYAEWLAAQNETYSQVGLKPWSPHFQSAIALPRRRHQATTRRRFGVSPSICVGSPTILNLTYKL